LPPWRSARKADLAAAGFHARFFLLKGVDHGDFGGELEGNRSLGEILSFVDDEPKGGPDAQSLVAR